MQKNEYFCTGEKSFAMKASKFACSVSKTGVERNSILCIKCNCWVHKRCSGIRKCLTKIVDFERRKCSGFTDSTKADEEVTKDGDVI